MQLTVCICTHNRPHYLRDCLDGMARQTAGPDAFAVLVVDSGSTGDAPADLARLTAALPNASLIRLDQPGVSLARNAGARACGTPYIAFIDDDAVPAGDWVACILAALGEATHPPAVLGGRVLPVWEAPLPAWWPPRLRGVLSIIEAEGQGAYGDPNLPADLAPYTVNMVVSVAALLAIGGFGTGAGRIGTTLLSDEDVQVAWRLRQAGQPLRYHFPHRRAPPDPGGKADPGMAAVAAILAGRVHRADPATAAAPKRGLARAATPLRGRRPLRPGRPALPPLHQADRSALAAGLRARLHPGGVWLACRCDGAARNPGAAGHRRGGGLIAVRIALAPAPGFRLALAACPPTASGLPQQRMRDTPAPPLRPSP